MASTSHTNISRTRIEEALRRPIYIDHFPTDTSAGQPIPGPSPTSASGYAHHASQLNNSADNPYAPFANQLEWDIGRWSKMCGPGSTSTSELLGINSVSTNSLLALVVSAAENADL